VADPTPEDVYRAPAEAYIKALYASGQYLDTHPPKRALLIIKGTSQRPEFRAAVDAARTAERERIAANLAVKKLDFKLFAKHQFQSSRTWPDGTKPTGPDWNPGCTCGASHYYFEHPRHLAEVTAEYVTGGERDA
jgi:hypothetical protein